LAFSTAISSRVLFAGKPALTTKAIGSMHTPPTGANCFSGSKLTFGLTLGSASVPLSATISTWPSGDAPASASAATPPEAPGRFSITNCCPSASESFGASTRAMVSMPPPGA
jgi:hypothetical protein